MLKKNNKTYNRSRKQPSIYSRTEADVVKRDFKRGFLLFLLFIAVCGVVYLLFLSPLFKVESIQVNDLKYGHSEIIQKIIEDYRDNLLNKNIITFQKKPIKEEIINSGGIKSVNVIKKYPNTVIIEVEERSPSLVWQVLGNKYLVDDSGIIWSDFKEQFDNVPVVTDTNNVSVEIGDKVVSSKFVKFITELADSFESYTDTGFVKIEISDSAEDIKVVSSDGWYAYFNTTFTAKNQLINLNRILKEVNLKNKKLEYIDLRIENRIFYK
jgi:cell division protein FtsQ